MGNVSSRTSWPPQKLPTTGSRQSNISSSLLVLTRRQEAAVRLSLRACSGPIQRPRQLETIPKARALSTKPRRRKRNSLLPRGQASAPARQFINSQCLEILGIPTTGVITTFSSSSHGWTFWDFKQSDGQTQRVMVIAVDGGHLDAIPFKAAMPTYPARSSIGVWFGNGVAEYGSPHNVCKQIVTSRAITSSEVEIVAATEGLVQLHALHSSGACEKGPDAIIKTDLMGMAEEMNAYISTGNIVTAKYRAIEQTYWDDLRTAVNMVESLGIKVAFWHVLRENNQFADALASHALKIGPKPFRFVTLFDTPSGIFSRFRRSHLSCEVSSLSSTCASSHTPLSSTCASSQTRPLP